MSKEACLCEKVRFFHFISDFSIYFVLTSCVKIVLNI